MKTTITDADIYEEAYSLLKAGVGLMNVIDENHFGYENSPEEWGSEYNYDNISKKFRAMSELINMASEMLDILEVGESSEYINSKIKYLAGLIGDNSSK